MSLSSEPLGFYGSDVAEAMLATLKSVNFTGRCEYYAGENFMTRSYCVGVGLKPVKREQLGYSYWVKLQKIFAAEVPKHNALLAVDSDLSELAELRALRQDLLPRGVVEFENGAPVRLLNAEQADSLFSAAVLETLGHAGDLEGEE